MEKLYDIYESLKKAKGVDDRQVIEATGIPRTTLFDTVHGMYKSPSVKNYEKLADYFGVSVDYLIGRK